MEPGLETSGHIPSCQIAELEIASGGLRRHILTLEEKVEDEIKTARARVEQLRKEKVHTSEEVVLSLLDEMKAAAQAEYTRTKDSLKVYYNHLADRNAAIKDQIEQVKSENSTLHTKLSDLQNKVHSLEEALRGEAVK